MYHHVWAEIDLNALEYNLKQLCTLVPVDKVMGVVKATAYGHGAKAVVNTLLELGVNKFAVSNVFEALDLRSTVKAGEVLILGYSDLTAVPELAKNNVTVCVFDLDYAKSLNDAAKQFGVSVNCHIKINSGMNRLGFRLDENFENEIKQVFELENINVTGAFTHFATADRDSDENGEFASVQYDLFKKAKGIISAIAKLCGKGELLFHSSNSAATLLDSKIRPSDIYRLGIVMYGLSPSADITLPFELKPVMSLKAIVSQVKEIKKGDTVSYGRTFKAEKNMRVATVTVGYADGYMRGLSGKGYMLINGKKANILGRVCMDQTVVDVTNIENVKTGDTALLFGSELPVDDLAKLLNTINYELVCAVGHRVPRVYLKNGKQVNEIRYVSL
ncbi:MAG: alanine racemase [Clostridia bacterium]|nr:alanine racemase [Clostridia bacterium]